jgi:hypothetical protein
MFTHRAIQRGVLCCLATLAALAITAVPAAPAAAGPAPASASLALGAFKPLAANPAAQRAAASLGLPVDEIVKAGSGRLPRIGASLDAVTCIVTGSAPHRASPSTNLLIHTTVLVSCDGAIRRITISIWLLWSLDNQSFTTLSNRLNERSTGTLFGVGTTGNIELCLPMYYIGLAHIWVNFLDGLPLEDGGWFSSDSIFIDCG